MVIQLDFISKSRSRGLIIEKWMSNKLTIRTLRREIEKIKR